MIFYLNTVITILAFVYFSYRTARKSMLLSPQMMFWGVLLYVIYLPGLIYNGQPIDNQQFNLVFTFASVGAIFACCCVKIPEVRALSSKYSVSTPIMVLLASPYFLYMLASVVGVVSSSGGVLEALKSSKLDVYLKGGILKGQTFELLVLIPKVAYYFVIGKLFYTGKKWSALILTLTISVFFVFTANTRLPIIMPIIAISLLYIHMLFRSNMLIVMPVLLSLGVGMLLFYSVVGNALRNGQIHEIGHLALNFKYYITRLNHNQLGYYNWMEDLYTEIEEERLDYDYGKAYFIYTPLSFVPRVLWSDKPITSTSNRLTQLVYGYQIGSGTLVYTFTVIGEGYWQFGYLGAAVASFLIIWMYCFLIGKILEFEYGEFWAMMILLHMMPFVRAELPTVHVILGLLTVLLFRVISRKKFSDSSVRNEL